MKSQTVSITIARPLEEVYEFLSAPMRTVANGAASEVVFTLFQQPSMPDAEFARDLKLVRTDLNALKKRLESTTN